MPAKPESVVKPKQPRFGQHYGRRKVDEVISALILTPHVKAAAEKTGVNITTIYRWSKEESFKEKLRLAKREIFEDGYTLLRQEFTNTVCALVKMRDDPNISDAVRLGAMRTLMEYGSQVDMMDHYDGKLAQLEAKTIDAVDSAVPETTTDNDGTNDGWINRTPDWKDQQDWQQ